MRQSLSEVRLLTHDLLFHLRAEGRISNCYSLYEAGRFAVPTCTACSQNAYSASDNRKLRLLCSLPDNSYWKLNPGGGRKMLALLAQWLLSAIALIVVAKIVPGFHINGLGPALIASLVIGLLNATLGFILKIITFPLSILTLGLFLLVINALMIELASSFVRGFHVHGFWPAFWGAIVLSLLGMLIRAILRD
jgi:putative membrane protein